MTPVRSFRLMPRVALFVVVLLVASACSTFSSLTAGEPEMRVLFVGNSHTHVNRVPDTVAMLADANGVRIEVDMVAPGGWTFAQHAADGALRDRIASGGYDVIVLQEQSELPAHHNDFQRLTAPNAQALARLAETQGAEVIFYQTWGRRDGSGYTGHGSFGAMQSAITASYAELASDNGAEVAQVGETWRHVRSVAPHIELFSSDGNHAAPTGSYLAAIVLTESILDVDLTDAPGHAGVDDTTAGYLLTYADGAPVS